MKILSINKQSQQQQTQPAFGAKFVENRSFNKLLKLLNDEQRVDLYKTFEDNAEKIQNMKVLGKDPKFSVSHSTNFWDANMHTFSIKHGLLGTTLTNNRENEIFIFEGAGNHNSPESWKGSEIANRLINGMYAFTNALTERAKDSKKYINTHVKATLEKVNGK